MKIVFLSKRRPQQKDLVTRPHGRFNYLPYMLAQKGHEVAVALLSYKPDRSVVFNREGVQWNSKSIFNWRSLGYFGTIKTLIRKTRPDWIIGFSDTYYGILAAYFGQKYGIHSGIDAYDNYESYLQWCKPLHILWRRAIRNADIVTAAGPQLAQYLNRFRPHKKVHIVPMAADPTGFKPMDRGGCRKKLNLPLDKILIGYCGALYRNRGIELIFQAYEQLRHCNQSIILVLTGPKEKKIQLPQGAKWLGYLPDEQMPVVLNCMDVLLVANQLSKFGNFSYPVKLYEAMACQVPVVATATKPAKWILNNEKQFLVRPGDVNDMAQKIKNLLQPNQYNYGEQNTWEKSCDVFETALLEQN